MVRAWIAAAVLLCACGGDDDRPASFHFIQAAILVPNCATSGCHSKQSTVSGLNFEEYDASYVFLLGPGGDGNIVEPGQPIRSQLLYLLRGSEIWRMPPDQPLPQADINLIERWILEGAQKN